jgi:predicted nucleic acid-binding protein
LNRVVVDASVVLASLISDGPTRGLLLGHHDLECYAPDVVVAELDPHMTRMADRTAKPREIVAALFADIRARLEVVPVTAYAAFLPHARVRAKAARAKGDEAYLALAEALSAPVWTYDKDFRRVAGLKVLSTREVPALAEATRRGEP